MSQFTFLASNMPLENLENPHIKMFSINQAIAQGIEMTEFLPDNIDRDKPNVLLWVADEEKLHELTIFETKNYSIGMKYNSIAEWVYTAERAEQLISYIRRHLESADSLEIWHVWLDGYNEIIGKPEIVVINIKDLTEDKLAKYLKDNDDDTRPVRIIIKNINTTKEML